MVIDLARESRRENPILEPVFDELRTLVDYSEASLYRVEGDICTLVMHDSHLPQVPALSLSYPVSTLMTEGVTIRGNSLADIEAIIRWRKPFEVLNNYPPEANPKSLITIPIRQDGCTIFLFTVGDVEPNAYCLSQADQVRQFALERMRSIQNGLRYAELVQRTIEAETMLSIQQAISSRLEMGAVLRLIVDEARNLTYARTALILDLDEDQLVLEAHSGDQPAPYGRGARWTSDGSSIAGLHGPVSSRHSEATDLLDDAALAWLGRHDFVVTPFRRDGQTVGMLIVLDKCAGVFDSQDERRLTMLASAAAICLENLRLYRQVRHLAALEERDRLSRELHDELAQSLFYVKIQASLVEENAPASGWETSREHLRELKDVVDATYSSVREAIFCLRHRCGDGGGYFASLKPFLADYRAHYGLNVTLEVAVDPLPELAPETETQLARIVQEALTNARRHASANHVCLRVERQAGCIVVRIIDDGKGFDVDAVLGLEGQRYGLQIMHERADTFGGRVELQSAPGCGSEVTVHIPEPEDGLWTQ